MKKKDNGKTAAQLADEGIRQAIEHAGPEWRDRASEAFRQFALTHAEFLCEDVRVWAETKGLSHPPDKRAWGHVARAAVKNHIAKVVGYAMTKVKPAHAGPRAIYRSNVFGGVTTYA